MSPRQAARFFHVTQAACHVTHFVSRSPLIPRACAVEIASGFACCARGQRQVNEMSHPRSNRMSNEMLFMRRDDKADSLPGREKQRGGRVTQVYRHGGEKGHRCMRPGFSLPKSDMAENGAERLFSLHHSPESPTGERRSVMARSVHSTMFYIAESRRGMPV